ncbi:MAG: hypothetical protein WCA15_07140 [Candidatus Acidiferrales bacterium]
MSNDQHVRRASLANGHTNYDMILKRVRAGYFQVLAKGKNYPTQDLQHFEEFVSQNDAEAAFEKLVNIKLQRGYTGTIEILKRVRRGRKASKLSTASLAGGREIESNRACM